MEVNCKLLSMIDSLGILMCEIEVEPDKSTEDENIVEVGLALLSTLKCDFSKGE